MPIIAAELKWYLPLVINNTGTNGGRMTANEITDAVKNNLWSDVPEAERVAGSTVYRKAFIKAANDADLTFQNPQIFVETVTPAEDRITFFVATQRDTQAGIAGSERKFGSGALDSNVSGGSGSIDVLIEDAATQVFVAGDTIRISDKTSVSDAGNNEEFQEIAAGGVSMLGNVATLTLVGTLANGYTTASNTRIASVYEPSDIVAAFASFVVTSGAGTYTSSGNLLMDSIGTIEQDWTLTFTSATAFDIVGDVLGSVGSGNISTATTPNNPDFTKPYFNMASAGFGGTFATNDTITFTTSPASLPIWHQRIIPAGASSFSTNDVKIAIIGASA